MMKLEKILQEKWGNICVIPQNILLFWIHYYEIAIMFSRLSKGLK